MIGPKDDHPAAIMASDVRKIPMGTVTSVGLTRKQTDRSQIKFESCLQSNNATFESKFGCPASQANCKLLQIIHGFKNCTMATFYGLPKQGIIQILLHFMYQKTHVVFFVFHFVQLHIFNL